MQHTPQTGARYGADQRERLRGVKGGDRGGSARRRRACLAVWLVWPGCLLAVRETRLRPWLCVLHGAAMLYYAMQCYAVVSVCQSSMEE